MSPALIIALAAAVFAAGGATGIKWQIGVQARATLAAQTAREGDAKRQVRAIDTASTTHVATLARLNNQLGTAREQIALLSGRECLDAGTVGLLNAIGHQPMPAAAAGAGIRFATERDTASAIATCRARYAELSSQLDQILDIEDARQ